MLMHERGRNAAAHAARGARNIYDLVRCGHIFIPDLQLHIKLEPHVH